MHFTASTYHGTMMVVYLVSPFGASRLLTLLAFGPKVDVYLNLD